MELYKDEIISELESKNDHVLTFRDIEQVLFFNKRDWRLPNSTTLNEFLQFLIEQKKILKPLEFGPPSRRVTRFLFQNKQLDAKKLALLLYPDSYLSHYSAVSFYDLTDEIIKSIYVNHEQSPKTSDNHHVEIPQENIHAAFSKPPRVTNDFIDYNQQRIYLINGKNTNKLGVVNKNGILVTDLERTLIDIIVRPHYSGGVFEVLNIFEKVRGEASVNRICGYLKKLNYLYPYHQALGFYLEKSGYKDRVIQMVEEKFPIKYDFYLAHDIPEKAYSERWRLFYPKNL